MLKGEKRMKRYCAMCGFVRDASNIVNLSCQGKRLRICNDCFLTHIGADLYELVREELSVKWNFEE